VLPEDLARERWRRSGAVFGQDGAADFCGIGELRDCFGRNKGSEFEAFDPGVDQTFNNRNFVFGGV